MQVDFDNCRSVHCEREASICGRIQHAVADPGTCPERAQASRRSYDMNRRFIAPLLSTLLMSFAFGHAPGAAQSAGNYKVDTGWARLPAGTTWNGNTSWITADGKGQVVVLVRTAPYFRVFNRDGAFVKAFGDDGLFQSAHSVTIDAQGILW